MDVIVVGYGKIGRIKAFIWSSLGHRVNVYDVSADKQQQALDDGFVPYDSTRQYDSCVVDISTPALFHLQSLEWVLKNISPLPQNILIEKPLASDMAEIQAIDQLLSAPENHDFAQLITVNESYCLSSALHYVTDDISKNNLKILSIGAELSKNRLDDVANGRFVDKQLGSLGIELTHMIAMVQWLGCGLDTLNIQDVEIYQKGDNVDNEGFVINLKSAETTIKLESYLGDFRIQNDQTLPNKMIRTLQVRTDKKDYLVMFDPVEGLERYKSKIIIETSGSSAPESIILDDNHLTKHLEKISNKARDNKVDTLTSPLNSLDISRLIFRFKAKSRLHKLGSTAASRY